MNTFIDECALQSFRFMHPVDRHPDENYIYVLHVSSGVIKVGYTCDPRSRLASHMAAAQAYGARIVSAWISEPHIDARASEQQLLDYCRERASAEIAAEHFVGLNFTDVVGAAEAKGWRRRTPADGLSLRFAAGAIRNLREANGWTLRGFASEAEINQGFLSKVERGLAKVSPDMMWRIADALGVSPAALTFDRVAFDAEIQRALREPRSAKVRARKAMAS